MAQYVAGQQQDVATTSSGLGAGAGDHLPVGDYSTMDYRSAMRFAVPAGWTAWTAITSATLKFYISDHQHVAPKNSSIFCSRMNVPVWTKDQGTQDCESGFSGGNNTQYSDIGSVSTNRISFSSGSTANAAKTLDVTAFVQYYHQNNSPLVFVFDNNGADQYTELWSLGKSGTTYDAVLTINYETNTAPYAPTLNSPVGSTVVGSATPTLNFTPLDPQNDTHTQYRYQIAIDAGFTGLHEDQTVGGSFPSNVAVNRVALNTHARGATYWWRVMTMDASGLWGPWSGGQPYVIKANPTVTINTNRRMTFIPSISGGDPRLCVDWTCDQPQATFRVTAPGYDSGIRNGGDQSWTLDTLNLTLGVAVTITVQVSNTDTPALNASASRAFTPRWSSTVHKRQLAAVPVNWQVPVIGSTVPAGTQLPIMYGQSASLATQPSAWYTSVASLPKPYTQFLWYWAWFIPSATQGPTLHSIDIPYDQTVAVLDKWGPNPAWSWENPGALPAGWVIDTGESVYGTRSIRADMHGGLMYICSNKFRVRAGRSYVASGLMRSQGNSGIYFKLQSNSEDLVLSPAIGGAGLTDWARYKTPVWVAPTDMDIFVVIITLGGTAGATGWWDGIKVEESIVSTPWNPATVGATTVDAGGVQIDGSKGGLLRYKGIVDGPRDVVSGGANGLKFGGDTELYSHAASKLGVNGREVQLGFLPYPNLCRNGGFRQGTAGWYFNSNGAADATFGMWGASDTGWTLRDGDVFDWAPYGPFGSTAHIYSSAANVGLPYVESPAIPVTAFEQYSASALVGLHRTTAKMMMWFYNKDYVFLSEYVTPTYSGAGDQVMGGIDRDNWQRLALEDKMAPGNASYCTIVLAMSTPSIHGPASPSTYLFMDQVQFNAGSTAGMYHPHVKDMVGGTAAFPKFVVMVGDRHFRTDSGMEFFWNGTRWLSTTLHTLQFGISDQLLPITGTTTVGRSSLPPLPTGCTDFWIESWQAGFAPSGTLNGSNYWRFGLNDTAGHGYPAYVCNGGALTWRSTGPMAIGSLATAGSVPVPVEFDISCTKTGTPGGVYIGGTMTYRYVAT